MQVTRRRFFGLFCLLAAYLVGAAMLWHWLGAAPRYVLPPGRLWHGSSDDGRNLLTVGGGIERIAPFGSLSQVRAGPVEIWDARTGNLAASVFDPGKPLVFALLSPDGHRLAVRDGELGKPGHLLFFKAPSGDPDGAIDVPRDVQGYCVRFAPDSQTLAVDTGTAGRPQVTLYDLHGDRPPLVVPDVRASFAFSPDGRMLAVTGSIQKEGKETETDVRLLDTGTGRMLATLSSETGRATNVTELLFSPDGAFLVAGLYQAKPEWHWICAWDVAQRRTVLERDDLGGLSFLDDGTLIASGQVGPTRADQGIVLLNLARAATRTIPMPAGAFRPCWGGHNSQPLLLVSTRRRQVDLPLWLYDCSSALGLTALSRQAIQNTSEVRSAHTGELLATYDTTGDTYVSLTSDSSAVLICSSPHPGEVGTLELWDLPPPSTLGRQSMAVAALALAFAAAMWLSVRLRR
jgi:WD40 repeat protein